MGDHIATARAHPNIAFIKYWGNLNEALRLPANSSFSMNLDGLYTETLVEWTNDTPHDIFVLNGIEQQGDTLQRVIAHLDVLRSRLHLQARARVISRNNFPTGAGIASSAAAFAALTAAAVAAAGVSLSERELTILARRGSGSAARSIPPGYVIWHRGDTDEQSYAESIAGPEHWDLVDLVAVVSQEHKRIGSTAGHASAWTSDLQSARVQRAEERLERVQRAVLERDFTAFAEIVEHDSNLMHAVMMTSRPPLFYWLPASLTVMDAVRRWRAEGLPVCYTLDAGPNVHCICTRPAVDEIKQRLSALFGVMDTLVADAGGGVQIVSQTSLNS